MCLKTRLRTSCMSSICQLLQYQTETCVTRYKACELYFFLALQDEADRIREYQHVVFFLDMADLLVTHFDLGAVSDYCLFVKGRVEIDVPIGDIDHTLEK